MRTARAVMRGMLILAALIMALIVFLGAAAYWWAFVANYEDEPVPWGLASVSPDGMTVRIAYPRGDRACHDLRRVEKQETSDSVVIEAIRKARTRGGACTDIYTQEEHDVELEAPLGDRRLVDRCAGAPPPSARDLGERFGELWRAGLDRGGPTDDPDLNICPESSLVEEQARE